MFSVGFVSVIYMYDNDSTATLDFNQSIFCDHRLGYWGLFSGFVNSKSDSVPVLYRIDITISNQIYIQQWLNSILFLARYREWYCNSAMHVVLCVFLWKMWWYNRKIIQILTLLIRFRTFDEYIGCHANACDCKHCIWDNDIRSHEWYIYIKRVRYIQRQHPAKSIEKVWSVKCEMTIQT